MLRRSLVCAGSLMVVGATGLPKGRDFRVGALVLAAFMVLPETRGKFRALLAQHGMVAGTDYTMVLGIPDESGQFAQPAQQLVADGVDVIVAMGGSASVRAAMQATSTIPIVMIGAPDPVGDHLVASLAHPGGNVTGLCTFGVELVTKRLQLLLQVLNGAKSIAYLKLRMNSRRAMQRMNMHSARRQTVPASGWSS